MNHGIISHNAGCIAEKIQGAICSTAEENVLGFISFHLNIVKSFSAIFSNTAFSLIALIALALVLLVFPVLKQLKQAAEKAAVRQFSKLCHSSAYLRKKSENHWLSFHENSPSSY
jgi:hypothetical protein